MCVCVILCESVSVCMCMGVHVCVRGVRVYVCVHVCMYVCVCVFICASVCVRVTLGSLQFPCFYLSTVMKDCHVHCDPHTHTHTQKKTHTHLDTTVKYTNRVSTIQKHTYTHFLDVTANHINSNDW